AAFQSGGNGTPGCAGCGLYRGGCPRHRPNRRNSVRPYWTDRRRRSGGIPGEKLL
ncbi:hypothetical protein, partial [Arthrobacter sp. DR-2P]